MANIGRLTPEIGSGVWGTPANFNGFRVLASLHATMSLTAGQPNLHDVWPSPGWYWYTRYIFVGWAAITLGIGPHSSFSSFPYFSVFGFRSVD